MKTTDGARCLARANKTRTNFSPSPIHFEVNDDAEIEKNVAPHDPAMHLPTKVLYKVKIIKCVLRIKDL
jgi:hypothetical protein